MKIIICGAGQVGWQIASHLSTEDNHVTVVDNNASLVRSITDSLDVTGIAGFASHPDILDRAGARDTDMIIAATHSDEVNMVTCQVAHSVFAVPRKIARLRAQSYLDAIYSDLYRREHMPIDVVISPEKEVAEAAMRRLSAPRAFDTELFLDGKVQLLGISLEESCSAINTPLRQLSEGGNVGRAIAARLEADDRRIRAKVIEKNRTIAEEAADALERTIVLHGDGLDMNLLEEANIGRADAVLAMTDDDKTNLLSSARAKAVGVPLVISLVNDPSLVSLLQPLKIDAYINPRATTVSSILRHIRHGRIRAVYSVGDAEAEVIEAQVLSSSPIAGKEIGAIDWPAGAIVGSIKKGSETIIPKGSTRVEEGDLLAVFVLAEDVQQVERLFQVSIDFF